jgi:serine phosphatase RsbU (regulator of sigma subunit)
MRFRLTIGRKIGSGFGVVIFFIIIIFAVTISRVNRGIQLFEQSKQVNYLQTHVIGSSINELIQLAQNVNETKQLIFKWAQFQSRDDDKDKIKLIRIVNQHVPSTKKKLMWFSKHWNSKQKAILRELFSQLDELFVLYEMVKENRKTFSDYEDDLKTFMVRPLVAADGDISIQIDKVNFSIDDLLNRMNVWSNKTKSDINESYKKNSTSYNFLIYLVILSGIALVVGSILIATFTTRSIVRPSQQLRNMLQMLGRGVFPTQKMKVSEDEIGEMTLALNNLVDGLKRTTNFSNQVGMGNFDYPYVPLSDEDVLGHALLKMRDDLAENERILEQKVIERTEEVVRQKEEIEKQRQKLEELYKDVTDSIRYAKRLQESILPPDFMVRDMFPESFVLYKPKDIVSGDFYWFHKRQKKVLFAAVDCTGHGVPGAFMSLVGSNAINQAIKEHGLVQPSLILDDINKISSEALNKGAERNSVRDGMDIALCALDLDSRELEFAGANNPLYLIRGGELTQIKPDAFAIGGFTPGTKQYTNHKIKLQKGDCLYIFSDGYADQFGGVRGKKFMYRQFRNNLLAISSRPMDEQRKFLDEAIESWRGRYEQVDDMLVIGVRV